MLRQKQLKKEGIQPQSDFGLQDTYINNRIHQKIIRILSQKERTLSLYNKHTLIPPFKQDFKGEVQDSRFKIQD